jgi:2',3'-cyclic-nucleotide 2'-phosphodiesterase/3'-nucleotidase
MKQLILVVMILFGTGMAEAANNKTVRLKIIETSDVHGHFFPYDFMERRPIKGTLARANTYVRQQRAIYGNNLLLIDNGDILQGQPCSYWSNYVMPEDENLGAAVVNFMGYDAETMGNHDVETGHAVYDKWIREVRCPVLGANIRSEVQPAADRMNGRPTQVYGQLQPYSVHYVDGAKVVVLGMITPTISHWLNSSLWHGMEFEEMVSCAKKWVKYIREMERPDLLLGLFHSGLNGGIEDDQDGLRENATAAVAREVPGFDIIFFGHDHQLHNEWITNVEGKKVLTIDPSCYVKYVAEADVELTYKNGHLTRKKIEGNLVDVSDMEVDQLMMDHFKEKIDEIKKYVSSPIATINYPLYMRESFFGNAAFTDLVHNLQLKITHADVSFNAPLALNTVIKAGELTQADMFKLYRFENLLYVLNMTGEEIRKHLESSYDMWTNTMKTTEDHALLLDDNMKGDQQRVGFKNYIFNFDSASGIDYEVDLTKADGQKVRILRFSDGRPFSEKAWYKVVMNSYRANGGGELLTRGAGISKDSLDQRIIFRSKHDLRYFLTEEIRKMGVVKAQPNSNWRFVPENWVRPALKRDSIKIFGKQETVEP